MRQLDSPRERRIWRRMLWVLIMVLATVCALGSALAIFVKMY